VSPTEPLQVRGRTVTLNQLIQSVHDRYDHEHIGREEPGAVIDVLSLRYGLNDRWMSRNGVTTSIPNYVAQAVRRFFAAGSDFDAAGLVEGGTHFLGGVGKALKRYRNSTDPSGQVAVMQTLVDQIVSNGFVRFPALPERNGDGLRRFSAEPQPYRSHYRAQLYQSNGTYPGTCALIRTTRFLKRSRGVNYRGTSRLWPLPWSDGTAMISRSRGRP